MQLLPMASSPDGLITPGWEVLTTWGGGGVWRPRTRRVAPPPPRFPCPTDTPFAEDGKARCRMQPGVFAHREETWGSEARIPATTSASLWLYPG